MLYNNNKNSNAFCSTQFYYEQIRVWILYNFKNMAIVIVKVRKLEIIVLLVLNEQSRYLNLTIIWYCILNSSQKPSKWSKDRTWSYTFVFQTSLNLILRKKKIEIKMVRGRLSDSLTWKFMKFDDFVTVVKQLRSIKVVCMFLWEHSSDVTMSFCNVVPLAI